MKLPLNILYIHGLNSPLSSAKKEILEQYGSVWAPNMDYEHNPNSFETLSKTAKEQAFDLIIGSSMGGLMGYHMALKFKKPALLFNPALAYKSVHQELPRLGEINAQKMQLILGLEDTVIYPQDTLRFLSEHLQHTPQLEIKLLPTLAHRIPETVFAEEVSHFLQSQKNPRSRRLFLDDERNADQVYGKSLAQDFDVVRSFEEFKIYLQTHGLPEFISFDGDLGPSSPDGLETVKWLIQESGLDVGNLDFKVHSSNPILAEQIRSLLSNYLKFLNQKVPQ